MFHLDIKVIVKARKVLLFLILLFIVSGGIFGIRQYYNYYKNRPPVPGSCLVVEQKYCSLASVVEWINPNNQLVRFIAFNLPAGAAIFSPFDGSGGISPSARSVLNLKATTADVIKVSPQDQVPSRMFSIIGDIGNTNGSVSIDREGTAQGRIIAFVQDTGITVLNYTVVLVISIPNPDRQKGERIIDEEFMRKIMPGY